MLVVEARLRDRRVAITGGWRPSGSTSAAPRPLGERLRRGRRRSTPTALFLGGPILVLVERSLRVGDGYGFDWYRGARRPRPARRCSSRRGRRSAPRSATPSIAATIAVVVGVAAATATAVRRDRLGPRRRHACSPCPLGASAVTVGLGYLVALDRAAARPPRLGRPRPARPRPARHPVRDASRGPALHAVDPRLRQAAAVLGAGPWRVWRQIDLALAGRAILVAAGFAFAISLGEFGATTVLARADTPTVTVTIGRLLGRPGAESFGQAAAMSVVLLVLTSAAVFAGRSGPDRGDRHASEVGTLSDMRVFAASTAYISAASSGRREGGMSRVRVAGLLLVAAALVAAAPARAQEPPPGGPVLDDDHARPDHDDDLDDAAADGSTTTTRRSPARSRRRPSRRCRRRPRTRPPTPTRRRRPCPTSTSPSRRARPTRSGSRRPGPTPARAPSRPTPGRVVRVSPRTARTRAAETQAALDAAIAHRDELVARQAQLQADLGRLAVEERAAIEALEDAQRNLSRAGRRRLHPGQLRAGPDSFLVSDTRRRVLPPARAALASCSRPTSAPSSRLQQARGAVDAEQAATAADLASAGSELVAAEQAVAAAQLEHEFASRELAVFLNGGSFVIHGFAFPVAGRLHVRRQLRRAADGRHRVRALARGHRHPRPDGHASSWPASGA